MRKYRGIVCEKKATYSVFLTEDGEFLRGAPLIATAQIGDEAEFQLIASATSSKRMKPIFIAPALIAAVLLIFLVASWFPQTTTAYAYIQVEGDSTIEIGVDEEGNVISLHSTTGVIKDWEGQSINLVLAKAVEQVSTDKKDLAVTTVYEKKDKPKLKKQIEKAVQEVKKANPSSEENSVETKPKNVQPKQEKTKPPGQVKKEEKLPNPSATNTEQKNPPTEKPLADKENKNESKINKKLPAKENKQNNNSDSNPGQEKKKNEDKSNNGNAPVKNNGNNGGGNNKNSDN
ncbi:hypothetical protein KD050_14695 [Psychrobacillus sp. INOP01]|uniref:anti-sigma factor domain-containing protein n=1 Tax=Psychrobacillus sp. INOP01 TaxID=2829187 RepID=UPI001BA5BB9A|nr:hypothetical protein [Psychrobacillus sp. INOP01]QUG40538.1 hypothetical protein KD050_14695 [Psychrobacillus sp. INOP01]